MSSLPHGTRLPGESCSAMEEADGRMILHVKDMVMNGSQRILLWCSDVDVLVLGISHFHSLLPEGLTELWVLAGVGTKRRCIPIHDIAGKMGKN